MIEQSHQPLMSSSPGDLDSLQRRANRQRYRHKQSPRSLERHQQWLRAMFASPVRSVKQLPTRFLLHTLVALVLPLAVALSQLPAGTLIPVAQPSAPDSSADFIAPVAPLSLDNQSAVGDAPLDDTGDVPVPLSLISRSDALAPVMIPATIAGDRVFLRSGPGVEYDAVGRMSADAPVQVIGRHGDWFQVRERAGKPISWISGELLNLPANALSMLFEVGDQDIPPPPPPKIALVRESGLALRDGPGTDYVAMSKLDAGAKLDLIERYNEWFHVGVAGSDGWVKSEFLTLDPGVAERVLAADAIPSANPDMVGLISENNVNVRKGPDSRYDKMGVVNAGAMVALLGKYNDWFRVKLDSGTKAWIFSDLLNVTAHVARRVPVSKDFPALPTTPKPSSAARGSGGRIPGVINIPASGDVASFAIQFAGSRYVYGGASPSGFDCSGFTSYVYRKFGVSLPHSAAGQYSTAYGVAIGSMSNLAPGDLVFFVGTAGERGISHVALYIGGGRVIHAMTPRYGVQVSNIYDSYWVRHYYGAIRIRR